MSTYQSIEPFSKQLTIVIGLTVVGFMAFGLALSFYRNVLFEQTLEDIRMNNDELEHTIAIGYRNVEYLESDQYKDKYAKENLGLINPGEKVLIITRTAEPENTFTEDTEERSIQQEAAYFELLRQMPTIEHWSLYLFHKERIEELKEETF